MLHPSQGKWGYRCAEYVSWSHRIQNDVGLCKPSVRAETDLSMSRDSQQPAADGAAEAAVQYYDTICCVWGRDLYIGT